MRNLYVDIPVYIDFHQLSGLRGLNASSNVAAAVTVAALLRMIKRLRCQQRAREVGPWATGCGRWEVGGGLGAQVLRRCQGQASRHVFPGGVLNLNRGLAGCEAKWEKRNHNGRKMECYLGR